MGKQSAAEVNVLEIDSKWTTHKLELLPRRGRKDLSGFIPSFRLKLTEISFKKGQRRRPGPLSREWFRGRGGFWCGGRLGLGGCYGHGSG